MTTPSRSYQRRTTSVLASEDAAERARRNGISPVLATSKEARARAPLPSGPPPALKGAVRVEAFPEKGPYPFREIATDGGIWKLDPAEFKTKPESIRSAAWSWAKKTGLTSKVVIDAGHVYVQFKAAE